MPICKLVCGIGIYEKGRYPGWVDNKTTKEYSLWVRMIQRCQPGSSTQQKQPAYIGCSVHKDFIKFQDFAEWCQTQIGFGIDGWALDKDIIVPSNKVYGPDTCAFVPRELNNLLTHTRSNKGLYPTGVDYYRPNDKFRATIGINGTRKHLGYFDTPEQAEHVYKSTKTAYIHRQAQIWKSDIDSRVFEALLTYKV